MAAIVCTINYLRKCIAALWLFYRLVIQTLRATEDPEDKLGMNLNFGNLIIFIFGTF